MMKLLCLMLFTVFSFAQSPSTAHSYIFASPNTRSELSDADAAISLRSFEQVNAIAVADRMGCSLTRSVEISNAIGVFENSSENSLIMESDLKRQSADYVAFLIGRYAHQEFVLIFTPDRNGKDKLWTITTAQRAETALAAGRELHFSSLTITGTKNGTEIWIVDSEDKLAQKLNALTNKLQGTAHTVAGVSELVGDEDRTKAAQKFQQKIDAFEKSGRQRLSRRLWSRDWRDATTRTCSREIKSN